MLSSVPQTKSNLEKLISDKVEESIHLDYKDARSFVTDGKKNPKTEIAKDVSAMANSAGGLIIYGIKEYDEPAKEHLPEKITPIDRTEFSREWLEQVINSNISPKIEGLLIYSISLDKANEVVYLVEVPQSTTAHQNTADGRYYKRYNFQSVWMVDYEVRDILNRTKHPVIEIDFKIVKETYELAEDFPLHTMSNIYPKQLKKKEIRTDVNLLIFPKNIGSILAKYINYFVEIPEDIVQTDDAKNMLKPSPGIVEFCGNNTYRDVVDVATSGLSSFRPKYGPSRFDPVLPGLTGKVDNILLIDKPNLDQREILWMVHADNSLERNGKIKLNEIPIIEKNRN